MKGIALILLTLTASLGMFPALLLAKQDHMAVLRLRITDPTGAVIPNAQIELRSEDVDVAKALSNQAGEVSLQIKPGTYTVVTSISGFVPDSRRIEVHEGAVQGLEIALRVGPANSYTVEVYTPSSILIQPNSFPFHFESIPPRQPLVLICLRGPRRARASAKLRIIGPGSKQDFILQTNAHGVIATRLAPGIYKISAVKRNLRVTPEVLDIPRQTGFSLFDIQLLR